MVNSIFDKFTEMDSDRPYKIDDYVCDTQNILPPGATQVFMNFNTYVFEINELTTYRDIHSHLTKLIEQELKAGDIKESYALASKFLISPSEVDQIRDVIVGKTRDLDMEAVEM